MRGEGNGLTTRHVLGGGMITYTQIYCKTMITPQTGGINCYYITGKEK